MKILVTGGAGYIGSVCVEELLAGGHQVTVIDNLGEGHRSAVDPRARFVQGHLGDRAQLEQVIRDAGAEAIVHFAGHALVGESMREPGRYFRNNVADGLTLLEAAVSSGVGRLVFSSTCATYGMPDSVPISEDAPQRPINPYGESKLMFERMLEWFRRIHGLDFVSLRYFNVAGASEEHGEHHRHETHLVPNVLRVALGQAPSCEIFGTDYPTPDGTCIRDYIHVSDLARAHVLALNTDTRGFYNLGNGEGYSVRQVIGACEQVSGRPIPTIDRPRRPGDPPRLVASATKAKRELGWQPQIPRIEDIVASAWRWMQRHPTGYPD
jgi:UDP-glucose 4-epimerase